MNVFSLNELVEEALMQGNKWACSQLINIFEDTRREMIEQKRIVLDLIEKKKTSKKRALFFGFTGSPGVGKSSLIDALVQHLVVSDAKIRIAILAVDPSSKISGGSFLGDRERLHFDLDSSLRSRIFFRSQAAGNELGGLSAYTYIVSRLLSYLFDLVFIETVGIGQNETEVEHLVDKTILVLQPNSGDHIQFLKAGIMEIPDVFVINKCDQEGASSESVIQLRSSLKLARLSNAVHETPIFLSSVVLKKGIEKIADWIQKTPEMEMSHFLKKEIYYLTKWVLSEYGRQGLLQVERRFGGVKKLLEGHKSFEAVQNLCSNELAF